MLLATFRSPELSPGGRLVERTAVRGVLFRGCRRSRAGNNCSGGTPAGAQQLEGYEAELELTPQWVTVGAALTANRKVMDSGVGVMRWLVRETAVLEWLSARTP
jgi:hypothetical protein